MGERPDLAQASGEHRFAQFHGCGKPQWRRLGHGLSHLLSASGRAEILHLHTGIAPASSIARLPVLTLNRSEGAAGSHGALLTTFASDMKALQMYIAHAKPVPLCRLVARNAAYLDQH